MGTNVQGSQFSVRPRYQLGRSILLGLVTLSLVGCIPPPVTTPAIPTGLNAVAGNGAVALSWNANSESDLRQYIVHWGSAANSLTNTVNVDKSQVNTSVTGLSNGTPYYFAIAAENSSGQQSAFSSVASATPQAAGTTDTTPPSLPTNVQASTGSVRGSINVSWNAVNESGMKGYNIYAGTSANALTLVKTVGKTETSTTLTGFGDDTTVYAAVQSEDLSGNKSSQAGPANAKTMPAPNTDTTPPTLASYTPTNSAMGVAVNSSVTLTFSEPMDQASVVSAFSLLVGGSNVAAVPIWSADGKTVTFDPADFSNGATVAWTLTRAAKDLAGNPIATVQNGIFTTIRRSTLTIPANTNLTDTFTNRKRRNTDRLVVGDTGASLLSAADVYRSYITFNLPSSATKIISASMNLVKLEAHGSPFSNLGAWLLQRASLGAVLENSDWDPPLLGCPGEYVCQIKRTNTPDPEGAINVTKFIQQDLADKTPSQFMMRFEKDTDDSYNADNLQYSFPTLTITYEYP